MDQLIIALANLGGVGVLAAALLWLHRDALVTFRDALKAEREANQNVWKEYLALKLRHHEEVQAQLQAHAEMLAEIRAHFHQPTQ